MAASSGSEDREPRRLPFAFFDVRLAPINCSCTPASCGLAHHSSCQRFACSRPSSAHTVVFHLTCLCRCLIDQRGVESRNSRFQQARPWQGGEIDTVLARASQPFLCRHKMSTIAQRRIYLNAVLKTVRGFLFLRSGLKQALLLAGLEQGVDTIQLLSSSSPLELSNV